MTKMNIVPDDEIEELMKDLPDKGDSLAIN